MRVALFTREYPPYVYGGAGVHVEYLSRELARRVEVEVHCFGDQHSQGGGLTVIGHQPWAALDTFFEVLFSEHWSNPEVLGAWTAFWTLTRSDEAFARINAAYNQRLGELLDQALRRLPARPAPPLDFDSARQILASVMDGLWLEFCLRPEARKRAEAVELCRLTLRRLMVAE